MAESVKKLRDQVSKLEEGIKSSEKANKELKLEMLSLAVLVDTLKKEKTVILKDNQNLRNGTDKLIKSVSQHRDKCTQLEASLLKSDSERKKLLGDLIAEYRVQYSDLQNWANQNVEELCTSYDKLLKEVTNSKYVQKELDKLVSKHPGFYIDLFSQHPEKLRRNIEESVQRLWKEFKTMSLDCISKLENELTQQNIKSKNLETEYLNLLLKKNKEAHIVQSHMGLLNNELIKTKAELLKYKALMAEQFEKMLKQKKDDEDENDRDREQRKKENENLQNTLKTEIDFLKKEIEQQKKNNEMLTIERDSYEKRLMEETLVKEQNKKWQADFEKIGEIMKTVNMRLNDAGIEEVSSHQLRVPEDNRTAEPTKTISNKLQKGIIENNSISFQKDQMDLYEKQVIEEALIKEERKQQAKFKEIDEIMETVNSEPEDAEKRFTKKMTDDSRKGTTENKQKSSQENQPSDTSDRELLVLINTLRDQIEENENLNVLRKDEIDKIIQQNKRNNQQIEKDLVKFVTAPVINEQILEQISKRIDDVDSRISRLSLAKHYKDIDFKEKTMLEDNLKSELFQTQTRMQKELDSLEKNMQSAIKRKTDYMTQHVINRFINEKGEKLSMELKRYVGDGQPNNQKNRLDDKLDRTDRWDSQYDRIDEGKVDRLNRPDRLGDRLDRTEVDRLNRPDRLGEKHIEFAMTQVEIKKKFCPVKVIENFPIWTQ